jgi:hypothetical protein
MHGVPLKADEPDWFASTHAGKDDDAVRDSIDELLEENADWSRGPHGLVSERGGNKEGIPCRKINPDSFEIACDDDGACQLDLELTDRTFGKDVSLTGLSESEAQQLAAMLLRFCGFRDPDPSAASGDAAAGGSSG